MRRLAHLLVFFALAGAPCPAQADRLIVYGPPGTGAERRALAVVESDAGRCASWDGVEARADEPGVQVTLEEPAGDCARWLRIVADPPRAGVTVHLHGASVDDAAAAVPMGSDLGLAVHATRAGRLLRVRVGGAPAGDPVQVTAVWPDAQLELEPRPGGLFVGEVPQAALVGVVARSGSLVGADALAGAEPSPQSRVLVLPSSFAIPAGAAVRTAALVVVTDCRGRLSRDVPLRIESARGRLRNLTWLRPGLASVALATAADTRSVDLTVWTTERASARTVEIPVEADWPARATIEAPERVVRGAALHVIVSATALGGPAVDGARVQVRCGGEPAIAEGDGFACTPSIDGPTTIVAGALVDGRFLPLGDRIVTVTAPPAPAVAPAPPPPAVAAPTPAAGPALRRTFSPAAAVLVGIDGAGRAAWGAGLRAHLALSSRLDVVTIARYTGASIEAAPVGVVLDALSGQRHGAELLLGAGVRVVKGPVSLVAGAAAGPSWVYSDVQIGETQAEGSAFRLVGQASLGPRTSVAGVLLGLDLGLRLVPLSSERTWREPLATAYLEVSGGL